MRSSRILNFVLVALLIFCVPTFNAGATDVHTHGADQQIKRLEGLNRYETAVEISKEGWVKSDIVILGRGDHYADVLAGVPLAYAYDAPILLTPTSRLIGVTKNEILRLGAKTVIILGGEAAVSADVENILNKEMGLNVQRIAGLNRYQTAAKIAGEIAKKGAVKTAVLVYNADFPDALIVSPYAAVEGYPILLVRSDSLHNETELAIKELEIKNFIIVDGEGSLSTEFKKQFSGAKIFAGQSRYKTAVDLAKYFLPSNDRIYLATGANYADAVVGGVLAAKNGNGMLLVQKDEIEEGVREYIENSNYEQVVAFGGTAAISNAVLAQAGQKRYVSGQVTDTSGAPVPGAIISTSVYEYGGIGDGEERPSSYTETSGGNVFSSNLENHAVTDENGYYTIILSDGIPEEYEFELRFEFNIQAKGYYFLSYSATADDVPSRLDCQLIPLGVTHSVKGTVYDSDQLRPVQNANVCAETWRELGEGWTCYYECSSLTDQNGNYVLNLPVGEFNFDITKDSFASFESDSISIDKAREKLDWNLVPLFIVSGRITWADGSPVECAEISAFENHINYHYANEYIGRTDNNGEYTMLLPKGEINFFVSDQFYVYEEDNLMDVYYAQSINTITGHTSGLNWTLKPMETFTVSGTILDVKGKPASGDTLNFDHYFFVFRNTISCQTDANGRYSVQLPAGRYKVNHQINDKGFIRDDIVVKGNLTHNLEWNLGKLYSVSGRVKDSSGKPVSGVEISVYTWDFPFETKSVTTDKDGYYGIQLYAGDYQMRVETDGYAIIEEFETIAGSRIIDYELTKLITIQGNVSLNGIDWWDVSVWASKDSYDDRVDVDEAGHYILHLPAGTYELEVRQTIWDDYGGTGYR